MSNPESLVGRYVIEHVAGSCLKGRVREYVSQSVYLVEFTDFDGHSMLELYAIEEMMEWMFFDTEDQRHRYLRSLDQ